MFDQGISGGEERFFEKSGNIREVVPIHHKKNIIFHLTRSLLHILQLLIPPIVTLLEF